MKVVQGSGRQNAGNVIASEGEIPVEFAGAGC
jgi:hypothetical protein